MKQDISLLLNYNLAWTNSQIGTKAIMGLNDFSRKILDRNKSLISNFSYLSLIQIANLLVPFIYYPYLINVLGMEKYGMVTFVHTIGLYFSMLINFGFDIHGAKEVAIYKNEKHKLSEIVSSIYIIKTMLFVFFLAILSITLYVIPVSHNIKLMILFSYFYSFNELLLPQWYFQGIEKLGLLAVSVVASKFIFLILIFFLINVQDDYILVPLLYGVSCLIGGVSGLYILFIKEKVVFKFFDISTLYGYLKESSVLFASNLVISVKDRFNIFFIGIFLGMNEVVVYDLGVKIMALMMKPIDVLNAAIYPRVARDLNMGYMKKIAKYSLLLVFFLFVFVNFFLADIVNLLAKDMINDITPIRILLLCPLVFSLSLPLARNCITVFKKYQQLLYGMIYTTMFYLLLILLNYCIGSLQNVIVFVTITLFVYLFELIYRIAICKKYKFI